MKQRTLEALQHRKQSERLAALGPNFVKRNKLMQVYARKTLDTRLYGRMVMRF